MVTPPTPDPPGPTWDELEQRFNQLLKGINEFGVAMRDHVRTRGHIEEFQAAAELPGRLFQKWNLEILYLVGLQPGARFNALQKQLPGISSRTLSLKLKDLESLGYVTRNVVGDRPLRVEYDITEPGRILARLTLPLLFHLQREGVRLGPKDKA